MGWERQGKDFRGLQETEGLRHTRVVGRDGAAIAEPADRTLSAAAPTHIGVNAGMETNRPRTGSGRDFERNRDEEMSSTITRIPRSDSDWIYTASGRKFWPLDPRPEEIFIEDIAHALARICRFNGHTRHFYSVAEHSVRVMDQVRERAMGNKLDAPRVQALSLWGLLHDASEAYICDLTRPMKGSWQLGRIYSGFEAGLMNVICERFGLPTKMPNEVRWADEIQLATEFRDLMPDCSLPEHLQRVAPLAEKIVPLPTPYEAQERFTAAFRGLKGWA